VKDLLATGPQTVLVIEYTENLENVEGGDKTQERMIPFVSHFVDDVNLIEKRITVDWQPDY
jgi:16S rRNA processing protein RimM